jgi:hypothetical protein
MMHEFLATEGSWAEANDEVQSFARSAYEHLHDALSLMEQPHGETEGMVILEALMNAQNSLSIAINAYNADVAKEG